MKNKIYRNNFVMTFILSTNSCIFSKFLPRGFSSKIFKPFFTDITAGSILICSGVAILIASNVSVFISFVKS